MIDSVETDKVPYDVEVLPEDALEEVAAGGLFHNAVYPIRLANFLHWMAQQGSAPW